MIWKPIRFFSPGEHILIHLALPCWPRNVWVMMSGGAVRLSGLLRFITHLIQPPSHPCPQLRYLPGGASLYCEMNLAATQRGEFLEQHHQCHCRHLIMFHTPHQILSLLVSSNTFYPPPSWHLPWSGEHNGGWKHCYPQSPSLPRPHKAGRELPATQGWK